MAGNWVLHILIDQVFPHQFSHIIIVIKSLQAPKWRQDTPSSLRKARQSPHPSLVTDTTAVRSITEDTEVMTSMQTGIAMAGAMATIAEETAVELGSGIHLGANKCSKDIVFIGSS